MDGFEILSCIVLKLLMMEENNEFDRLVNQVKPLVKSWTRNRSGFGSFQHYKKLLLSTALLVMESGIFVSPKSLSTPIFLTEDLLRLLISNYRDFYENILTNPNTLLKQGYGNMLTKIIKIFICGYYFVISPSSCGTN